ncbi:MAG: hypothetical protein SFU87_09425 [Chitinophagaceae bacterium]|nr:hypothetical protein [Chitinophagaceae bacterium]
MFDSPTHALLNSRDSGSSKIAAALLHLVTHNDADKDHDSPGHINRNGDQVALNFRIMPETEQNCGGLCFAVAKKRVDQAFKMVTGKGLADWIPDSIGTKYLNARQAFDWIWGVNTQDNDMWRSLYGLRACGSAGALKLAGLGEFKVESQVWRGELKPGAVVQTFVYSADYTKVFNGIDAPKAYNNLASYGHSFIFLEYVKDPEGIITGMKVADQGFLNGRVLNKDKFQVWFGANIIDPK